MQDRYVGNIGDFGKIALLRHLMEGRRLAVCWYLTSTGDSSRHQEKYFNYLNRPSDFRHFAPDVFDALKEIVGNASTHSSRISVLEASELLGGVHFHGNEVPKRALLRRSWARELVESVNGADLVFLDADNGIQGTRLTPKHVALAELAALRRQDRALIVAQRPSGRQSQAKFLANRLQSIGCERIELVRFRLVFSHFYVVADHDEAMSLRIASFARKWGNWVKTYRF